MFILKKIFKKYRNIEIPIIIILQWKLKYKLVQVLVQTLLTVLQLNRKQKYILLE